MPWSVSPRPPQILALTTSVHPTACLHYVVWVTDELLQGWPQVCTSPPLADSVDRICIILVEWLP